MQERTSYSLAGPAGLPDIKTLLLKSELPIDDVDEKISFIAAHAKGSLVGCIGLERHGKHGLLRSFAVENSHRSTGIGNELLSRLLDFCRQSGIEQLHLLTTTADQYFLKKGFLMSDREKAPASIKSTAEFSSLCPASSVYMVGYLV